MRDPCVFVDHATNRHVLIGTTDPDPWQGPGTGFNAYTSRDLINWSGPVEAFRPPPGFWATTQFWAPEIHRWGDAFYLFASFKAAHLRRGTAVLVADQPEGPYRLHSEGAITPTDWECLDGTLHLDDEARPWIVFSHEWLQVRDGRICAQRLAPDLRRAIGEPLVLFNASSAPWVHLHRHHDGEGFITDGPWLHRLPDRRLLMLWSSFGVAGYALGQARSLTGDLAGPWEHAPEPLSATDGGHGMAFRDLAGVLRLALHAPNNTPDERPRLLPLRETADGWLASGE